MKASYHHAVKKIEEVSDGVMVEIYTMAGHLAVRGTGSFAFELAPGIYIVRTPENVRKISII